MLSYPLSAAKNVNTPLRSSAIPEPCTPGDDASPPRPLPRRRNPLLGPRRALRLGELLPDHVRDGALDVPLPEHALPLLHLPVQGAGQHGAALARPAEGHRGGFLVGVPSIPSSLSLQLPQG